MCLCGVVWVCRKVFVSGSVGVYVDVCLWEYAFVNGDVYTWERMCVGIRIHTYVCV